MNSKTVIFLVLVILWIAGSENSFAQAAGMGATVVCCGEGGGDAQSPSVNPAPAPKREAKAARINTLSQRSSGTNPYAGVYTLGYSVRRPCSKTYTSLIVEFDGSGNLVRFFGKGLLQVDTGGDFAISGSVDNSGNVSWTFSGTQTDGTSHAEFYSGLFVGEEGSGTISAQIGSQSCSGAWYGGRQSNSLPDPMMEPEQLYADPVNTATGAYTAQHAFLNQNTPTDLALKLSYSSDALQTGALGTGWSHKYETRIDVKDNEILALYHSPQRKNWFVRDGTTSVFRSDERGVQYDTVTKNTNGTFVLNKRDQSRIDFDAAGQMTKWTSPQGEILTFIRNNGRLASITDEISGRHLYFGYNTGGNLSVVADDLLRYVWVRYGSNGMVQRIAIGADLDRDGFVGGQNENASETTYTTDAEGRILTGRDGNGVQFVRNVYDSRGRVVLQDDARKETPATKFAYDEPDPNQRRTIVTDRNGKTLKYVYDLNLQLLEYEDQKGNKTTFTYDADFNRTSLKTPVGETTTFSYDAGGNLLSATDHYGRTSSMAYDARNNLTKVTDAGGKATTFTYDAKNNLTASTNPLNQAVSFAYDANSLLTRRTSSRNGRTDYAYSGGLPASVTDANGNVSRLEYDGAGRVVRVVDAAGFAIVLEYDVEDNILSLTNQRGQKTTYTYDRRRRKTSETNALGKMKRWTYDGNGNVTTATDLLGKVTRFSYGGEDRLLLVIDPLGKRSSLTYDTAGRLAAMTDGLGRTKKVERDGNGNVTKATDARGFSSLTEYLIDLPWRLTDPLDRISLFSYDAKRRLQESTNPMSEKTGNGYDDIDRLVAVLDPLSQRTGQAFDADGNRASITNARNAVTSFTYDLGNRLTRVTTGGGRTTNYTYDSRNLPATIVEPSGQSSSFTYDEAQRLTRLVDPVGQIDYGYDDVNRLLTVSSGGKTISREYDAVGRVTKFTDSEGNVLRYTWDAVGNLVKLTYPDGKTVAYAYDAANRMSRITDWKGRTTKYAYDADGRLIGTTRPNGTVETRVWNEAGELAELVDTKGGAIISAFHFTRDLAGRIVAEHSEPIPADFLPASFTAAYDSDNRLTTFNGAAVTYDADSNMINGPVVKGSGNGDYANDARNRLTSFGGVSYGYDAEDRRISLTDGTGATKFVINPVATLSQVLVRTTPDGKVTRAVYGLGLLYEETGSDLRYFHYDYRGSAVAFTNASGSVIGRAEYGPYGELAATSGNSATPFLFNGRYGVMTDSNGLLQMRARYYNPRIKRFVNQDIMLGEVEVGITLNRFAYANGNPVAMIDPFGLAAVSDDRNWIEIGWDGFKWFSNHLFATVNSVYNPIVWGYNYAAGLTGIDPATGLPLENRAQVLLQSTAQIGLLGLGGVLTPKGSLVGSSFGKLGTVVENPNVAIQSFSKHGIDQVLTRGVSPTALKNTIASPTVVLRQSGGQYLYISKEAAVAVTPSGRVISTYPASMFDSTVKGVLQNAR
jgi:RHS repeat-associated protein